jgi:hypothetical protein
MRASSAEEGEMRNSILLVGVLAGCGGATRGSSTGPGPMSGDQADGGGVPQMMQTPDPGPYPQGPYGGEKGNTLPNLALEGYRLTPAQTDSTMATWATDIHLGEYRKPDCKCLVVTLGALWCTACQDEQPQLISDVANDPSFCVVGIVLEGEMQGSMATRMDVDTWTHTYKQNFTVAKDTAAVEQLLYPYMQIGLPFSYIVKPDTMKILDVVQGFDPGIHGNAQALCGD